MDKENKNRIRYFWDGGLLSNTPFRELLRAHEEYWRAVERDNVIPDLEVYIVNLHPSKIAHTSIPALDHDGVKARLNDITFCDRNSHYDEATKSVWSKVPMMYIVISYNNPITTIRIA